MKLTVRVLIQRVLEASVSVEQRTIASIGPGLLLLVGFAEHDHQEILSRMADKVLHLRLFADEEGKMNRSLLDTGGAVLSVSQFTLYADLKRGRRPSFTAAASPDKARALYEAWNMLLKRTSLKVETGSFGADMKVSLINDGPVTFWLDSDELFN